MENYTEQEKGYPYNFGWLESASTFLIDEIEAALNKKQFSKTEIRKTLSRFKNSFYETQVRLGDLLLVDSLKEYMIKDDKDPNTCYVTFEGEQYVWKKHLKSYIKKD